MRFAFFPLLAASAVIACIPLAALAAGTPGAGERDVALQLSAAPGALPARGRMTVLRVEPPSRVAPPVGVIAHELPAQEASVLRASSSTTALQFDERNELRYQYAGGSSLGLSARSHHLMLGWRTRF